MTIGNGKVKLIKKNLEKGTDSLSEKIIDGLKMTENQLHTLIKKMEDNKKNYIQKHPLQGLAIIAGILGGAWMMLSKLQKN